MKRKTASNPAREPEAVEGAEEPAQKRRRVMSATKDDGDDGDCMFPFPGIFSEDLVPASANETASVSSTATSSNETVSVCGSDRAEAIEKPSHLAHMPDWRFRRLLKLGEGLNTCKQCGEAMDEKKLSGKCSKCQWLYPLRRLCPACEHAIPVQSKVCCLCFHQFSGPTQKERRAQRKKEREEGTNLFVERISKCIRKQYRQDSAKGRNWSVSVVFCHDNKSDKIQVKHFGAFLEGIKNKDTASDLFEKDTSRVELGAMLLSDSVQKKLGEASGTLVGLTKKKFESKGEIV